MRCALCPDFRPCATSHNITPLGDVPNTSFGNLGMSRKKTIELPEVNFSEDGEIRYLHLGTEWIQGSMFLDRPYDIELEYVQRMFGWLLFYPHTEVKGAHAMQLGLGAGTITKFCYKKLKMTTTAIELNPGVLHAWRGWFR